MTDPDPSAPVPLGAEPAAALPPLPTSPEALFVVFEQLGIQTSTYDHPPLRTVAESKDLRGTLPGGHCKSLFLKDKKARLWLLVALEDAPVELNRLHPLLGSARLSFANADLLWEALGVRPGAVTPFALINDSAGRVTVVLQRAMLDHDPLNYHPLVNDRTTAIAPDDLLRFIDATGHRPHIIDLPTVAAAGG